MSIFKKHLFVCTFGKTCAQTDATLIFENLKQNVYAKCDQNEIRVNRAGCLGQCGHGPIMVLYPDNVWYSQVKLTDVNEITNALRNNQIIDRLIYQKENE